MRTLPSILCVLLASGPLAAAETWRWVDRNGVVHYSDRPQDAAQDGAEKVNILAAPNPGSVAPTPTRSTSSSTAAPFRYAGCEVVSPNEDQVFQNVRSVSVSLSVVPALQMDHTIVVRLNGAPVQGWPRTGRGYVLNDLPRGSFTVTAQVRDQRGAVVCSSSPRTFHIRQPSILTPGARNAR
jgi:hypothetical protein